MTKANPTVVSDNGRAYLIKLIGEALDQIKTMKGLHTTAINGWKEALEMNKQLVEEKAILLEVVERAKRAIELRVVN